ncbi:MAG: Vi polysaccharide biosynthesis UDP-N-acetylglucosamine C-6 dehydrogenase TviB, partial [Kiritimatiellia bacterium]|jgi:UDP-N-acetyl-D-galactosamine dehydrogenase|nr:Vi polysaccharide biosynthesis UDP-N-acetylglucosamine C-6 dehydrogenase TviB [Kiritimatiellia bacterium]
VEEVREEYGLELVPELDEDHPLRGYSAVVLTVAHENFKALNFGHPGTADVVLFDLKGLLPRDQVDGRL